MGRYDEAEKMYLESLKIREKTLGPEHPVTALSMNNLAEFYLVFGDPEKARDLHERVLAIREKTLGPNHPDTAQSLNNLAQAYEVLGDYNQAEPLLERARAIWENTLGPDHPDVAIVLNNLAEFYKTLGDYQRAEPLYRRSLEIREKVFGPDHISVALSLNNLAGLYDMQKKRKDAIPLMERALAIWEKALGPDHPDVATGLNNLAGLYFSLGQWEKAEPLDRRALEIRKKVFGDQHPDVAQSLNNLAGFYLNSGQPDEAESLYKQAVGIMTQVNGERHPKTMEAYGNLAVLYASGGRYREAYDVLRRIQEINEEFIDQVMAFTSEDQKLKFLESKRFELDAFFSLISRELSGDASARRAALDTWLRRKGIILESQRRFQEALLYRDAPKAQKLFRELAKNRARLSHLVFSGPGREDPETYKKRLTELEEKIAGLEAELTRLSQAYAKQRDIAKADSLKVSAGLPEGSVLLEFARYERFDFQARTMAERWQPAHYLVFVLYPGAGRAVAMIDLGEAAGIDALVESFKREVMDLENLESGRTAATAARLYDLVFRPLRPALGASREVFISPDGNLNLIPFEVLRDPDGRYLIEDFTFNYLSSGRDVLRFDPGSGDESPREPGEAVLMGDPDFNLDPVAKNEELRRMGIEAEDRESPGNDRSSRSLDLREIVFSPLEGTREEVLAIQSILGKENARVYLGPEVVEEVLRSERAPSILHLATHGFFLEDLNIQTGSQNRNVLFEEPGDSGALMIENPLLRSGLALAGANRSLGGDPTASDGILTAQKVLGLNLHGTDLVVLSACQTGLGDVQNGEGVYGLRRAFSQAGAEGLVLSMWSVPDLETKELMVEFYRNIDSKGMNRAEALRQAALKEMKKTRARYGYDHPLFWGAFVFVGRP